MYATIHVLRNIIYGAVSKGANLNALCESINLDPTDLNDAERRIAGVDAVVSLWKKVIEQTKDESFGLHLGANNNVSFLGLIGYLLQNCPTLKEVIEMLQKHQKLLSGWFSYEMKIESNEVVIHYVINPLWSKVSPETARQAVEMSVSSTISIMNILAGKNVPPVRIESEFPKPAAPDEHERIYGCPVTFSKQDNRLFFRKDFLITPVMSHDRSLYVLFRQILHERETVLSESMTFVEKVRRTVIHDFKGQVPPVEVIASHLNLSSRSFQRKLEGENTSYRQIANEIKKELTLTLLRSPHHTTGEIAKVLGYTEPSAFHAAFKSWTNETPTRWRERNDIRSPE